MRGEHRQTRWCALIGTNGISTWLPCVFAFCPQQTHRLLVEAEKGLGAEPFAFMGDDAIAKIAACLKDGKSRLDRGIVHSDIVRRHQGTDNPGDVGSAKAVESVEDPAEFAKRGQGNSDQFRFRQDPLGPGALDRIIFGYDANKNIGVSRDLHSSPAHPLAMISFISSIETGFRPSRFSMPKASEIRPWDCSAITSIRPLGSLWTVIFDPACTPRCCRISFRRVIWPLVVTVRVVIGTFLPNPTNVRKYHLTFKTAAGMLLTCLGSGPAAAQPISRDVARHAAIHPVGTPQDMQLWLSRVPVTRDFPPDFNETLSGEASLYIIEMTTAPGCLPCADLWGKLGQFSRHYHWQVRTISSQEAMLRSGRLGVPWVGHPVAWIRPVADADRIIPIAIGTDHGVNLARNAYLAAKMLTGVRPAVGLRAMARFTGIVGAVDRVGATVRSSR